MKLLVVSHPCSTAVNQGFFADVAQATGWDVSLIIPSQWKTEYRSVTSIARWKGFKGEIHTIPVWNPGRIPTHVYKNSFIGLFRELRPDAIYMHHEPYGLATYQVYLANRLTVNCPIGFYAAQNIVKTYPYPIPWAESLVLQASNFCFPVTEGALTILRNKGYSGVAEVLPLSIDRNLYYPMKDWARQQRTKLGIGPDEFVLGFLGRFVEEKGIGTLIRALAQLKERTWRCVLAGSGPYEVNLRSLIAELGLEDRVIFTGYVPHEEAPGWLTLFDVLVLPSETRPHWKEQFGRVITEANACGTVAIGSDSGEIPTVIRATGGGIVFPEGDVGAMVKSIVRLMDDPVYKEQLAATGAESVRQKYDQEHLVSRFSSVINSVVVHGAATATAERAL